MQKINAKNEKLTSAHFLINAHKPFPPLAMAIDTLGGLIAIGGELSRERLLKAYRQGIFPWYNEDEPILWYSPEPRMIITKARLKINKSLAKLINKRTFIITVNRNFQAVIAQCATIKRRGQNGTWINEEMQRAYIDLHHYGYAHSLEVYQNNTLVGGLYGVALGRVFFGESMFSKVSNASKLALVHLLKNMPYTLVDCQIASAHLKSLGAFTITRAQFITYLDKLIS